MSNRRGKRAQKPMLLFLKMEIEQLFHFTRPPIYCMHSLGHDPESLQVNDIKISIIISPRFEVDFWLSYYENTNLSGDMMWAWDHLFQQFLYTGMIMV